LAWEEKQEARRIRFGEVDEVTGVLGVAEVRTGSRLVESLHLEPPRSEPGHEPAARAGSARGSNDPAPGVWDRVTPLSSGSEADKDFPLPALRPAFINKKRFGISGRFRTDPVRPLAEFERLPLGAHLHRGALPYLHTNDESYLPYLPQDKELWWTQLGGPPDLSLPYYDKPPYDGQ
jgi:hypothetical protein